MNPDYSFTLNFGDERIPLTDDNWIIAFDALMQHQASQALFNVLQDDSL